eukprot:scaffold2537_cov304-Pinguiococcus_pyrenoidosus.AAC.3
MKKSVDEIDGVEILEADSVEALPQAPGDVARPFVAEQAGQQAPGRSPVRAGARVSAAKLADEAPSHWSRFDCVLVATVDDAWSRQAAAPTGQDAPSFWEGIRQELAPKAPEAMKKTPGELETRYLALLLSNRSGVETKHSWSPDDVELLLIARVAHESAFNRYRLNTLIEQGKGPYSYIPPKTDALGRPQQYNWEEVSELFATRRKPRVVSRKYFEVMAHRDRMFVAMAQPEAQQGQARRQPGGASGSDARGRRQISRASGHLRGADWTEEEEENLATLLVPYYHGLKGFVNVKWDQVAKGMGESRSRDSYRRRSQQLLPKWKNWFDTETNRAAGDSSATGERLQRVSWSDRENKRLVSLRQKHPELEWQTFVSRFDFHGRSPSAVARQHFRLQRMLKDAAMVEPMATQDDSDEASSQRSEPTSESEKPSRHPSRGKKPKKASFWTQEESDKLVEVREQHPEWSWDAIAESRDWGGRSSLALLRRYSRITRRRGERREEDEPAEAAEPNLKSPTGQRTPASDPPARYASRGSRDVAERLIPRDAGANVLLGLRRVLDQSPMEKPAAVVATSTENLKMPAAMTPTSARSSKSAKSAKPAKRVTAAIMEDEPAAYVRGPPRKKPKLSSSKLGSTEVADAFTQTTLADQIDEATLGGGVRRERIARGVDGPKPCMSAAMMFGANMYSRVQREMPRASKAALMERIHQLWMALNLEERQPYELLAEEDQKRFRNECVQFARERAEAEAAAMKMAIRDRARALVDLVRRREVAWEEFADVACHEYSPETTDRLAARRPKSLREADIDFHLRSL